MGKAIWVILTPDGDIYEEDLRALGFIPATVPGKVPRSLTGEVVYQFEDITGIFTAEDWAEAFREGEASAVLLRSARGAEEKEADAATRVVGLRFGLEGFVDLTSVEQAIVAGPLTPRNDG